MAILALLVFNKGFQVLDFLILGLILIKFHLIILGGAVIRHGAKIIFTEGSSAVAYLDFLLIVEDFGSTDLRQSA